MKDIERQLRRAIVGADVSRYRLGKLAGVSHAVLSLFVNKKRTLTLTTAAKLARRLGLELAPAKNGRKPAGKGRQ